MRGLRPLGLLAGGLSGLAVLFGVAIAGASSANISHSYSSSAGSIAAGSLVSLDPERSEFVQPANTKNAQKLVGVAVASDDSLLAIDADNAKVQVATSGTVGTLVSTLGGNIKRGDQISVSPFDGVGMKAEPSSRVIGLAQTDFTADSEGVTTETVKNRDGRDKEIVIGYIDLAIGIGTAAGKGEGGAKLNTLQRVIQSVTGHVVSTWRALVALLVAVVACVAVGTLMYASIFGSIISIGRNPLAKFAILRTLGSVMGMAALISLVASATIYLLLL